MENQEIQCWYYDPHGKRKYKDVVKYALGNRLTNGTSGNRLIAGLLITTKLATRDEWLMVL